MRQIPGNDVSNDPPKPLGVPELPDVHGTGERSEFRKGTISSLSFRSIETDLSNGLIGDTVRMIIFNAVALSRNARSDILFRGVALDLGEECRERRPRA